VSVEHRHAGVILLGAAFLFAVLLLLFVLEPDGTGRATSATQVRIVNATAYNCTVAGVAGRNLVSFPCISSAEVRSTIVGDVGLWAMYQYTPSTADKWRVHNPNLPSWVVSDLQYLSRRAGYVLILNTSATYTANGSLASSTDVPILVGWSLVGYPSNSTVPIGAGLAGVNASLTEVRTYDPSAVGYRRYFAQSGTGNLTNLTPGVGYWMNGTAGVTWTVTP